MSYPPSPPEGSYPPAEPPQSGQGEQYSSPPASPYSASPPYSPPPQQPPTVYPPIQQVPQYQPPVEQASSPFEPGQPTAHVPVSGFPPPSSPAPAQPAQPSYLPGAAPIPGYPAQPAGYPAQPAGYGEGYPAGLPNTSTLPPVSGAAVSGVADPMSGPGMYSPPLSVSPYGEPPKPKRGPAIPVLAGLTVLFFLVSAVMTGLFVTKSGDYDKKVTDVKTRDATISSLNGQLTDLKTQLQSTKDQLDAATQKQSGTQTQLDEVTKEKQVISNCLTLLEEAIVAASNGDQATARAKAQAAQQPCDESEKYIS
jgi:hypothetical protein